MTDLEQKGSSTTTPYSLDDRYSRDDGTVFATGVQAVARIMLEQLRVDRANGLRTAAFASGYPGSPLASLDRELANVAKIAQRAGDHTFVFLPGLNEELAATAVMGSQLTQEHGESRFDGVMGLWFGKAPGLDRACDAIRHAAYAGTHPKGGVLCVVGDDPAAKSSTLPSSSDATLVDLHLPILYPVDVQDALDLGRHGIALSRASGLWAGLKIVANVADGTAAIDLDPNRVRPVMPEFLVDGRQYVPKPDARFIPPHNLLIEHEILDIRAEIARRYGVANDLNRVTVEPGSSARIGIAACGYTYGEVREALARLGLRSDTAVAEAGIRLMALRMPVPLDADVIRAFAHDLREVIVVEEKNPTLEWLVKDALWNSAERPMIVGKQDAEGRDLFPRIGHLDADAILAPLRRRLTAHLGEERLAPLPALQRPRIALQVNRTPWFCSGCPHNWGTKVPEGTLYGAGIGCHAMTTLMEPERVGELAAVTAMGNEGMPWLGMAPFVTRTHFIQNLGDGTYFHSGQLAVQAAVAAGSNITFKLLHNSAVAMTGGQDAPGRIGVPGIARTLIEHGVREVLITTADPKHYERRGLPGGVKIWDRTRIVEAQEHLRSVKGVTVLIHDQECAAELRRDRKRGTIAAPTFRVVINERVCEGCGHCGETSGCLSLQPIDTEFGRKTAIDQTSCNIDASCLNGDCPSFMVVENDPDRIERSTGSGSRTAAPADLPEPVRHVDPDDCTIRMAGIGGTGVITVSQVLGTAALLEGRAVRGLDQTGLSQKAGPVVSDLRIGTSDAHASNKAGTATADVLLAFDLLVGEVMTSSLVPEHSVVIGSFSSTPTGEMVVDPRIVAPAVGELTARLGIAAGREPILFDATRLTTALLGDATAANVAVLGAAYQVGAIPVSAASIEEAIRLNGVAVDRNIEAFRWGRATVAAPDRVESALAQSAKPAPSSTAQLPPSLRTTVEALGTRTGLTSLLTSRVIELVAFQDERCASDYLARVGRIADAEGIVTTDTWPLTETAARYLYQLTAYKDEYEVARLLIGPSARSAAEAVGGPGAKFSWKLHPPMLRSLGMKDKLTLGQRSRPMLVALARAKRLRGTAFDPFGRAHVRRLERSLLAEYRIVLDQLASGLTPDNWSEAQRIAALPEQVRGYEARKVLRAGEYRTALAAALDRWPT